MEWWHLKLRNMGADMITFSQEHLLESGLFDWPIPQRRIEIRSLLSKCCARLRVSAYSDICPDTLICS